MYSSITHLHCGEHSSIDCVINMRRIKSKRSYTKHIKYIQCKNN